MALAKNEIVDAALIRESDGRKDHRSLKQRTIRAVQEMYREHAAEVLKVRLKCLRDEKAEWKDRLKAASDIDNRGQGTPASTLNLNTETNQGDMLDAEKMAGLPQEELQRTIETIRALVDQSNGGDLIDVSPEQENAGEDEDRDEPE